MSICAAVIMEIRLLVKIAAVMTAIQIMIDCSKLVVVLTSIHLGTYSVGDVLLLKRACCG